MTLCDAGAMLYQLSCEAKSRSICSSEELEKWKQCIFEVRAIDESLWNHQMGGKGVFKRQLLTSEAHNEPQPHISVTTFSQTAI